MLDFALKKISLKFKTKLDYQAKFKH